MIRGLSLYYTGWGNTFRDTCFLYLLWLSCYLLQKCNKIKHIIPVNLSICKHAKQNRYTSLVKSPESDPKLASTQDSGTNSIALLSNNGSGKSAQIQRLTRAVTACIHKVQK